MNGGIILVKVVGHCLDFVLDSREVCAVLGNNKALSGVLLACCELGVLACTNGVERLLYGHCVLTGVKHSLNAANRVGMALAYALTPEGVCVADGKD